MADVLSRMRPLVERTVMRTRTMSGQSVAAQGHSFIHELSKFWKKGLQRIVSEDPTDEEESSWDKLYFKVKTAELDQEHDRTDVPGYFHDMIDERHGPSEQFAKVSSVVITPKGDETEVVVTVRSGYDI